MDELSVSVENRYAEMLPTVETVQKLLEHPRGAALFVEAAACGAEAPDLAGLYNRYAKYTKGTFTERGVYSAVAKIAEEARVGNDTHEKFMAVAKLLDARFRQVSNSDFAQGRAVFHEHVRHFMRAESPSRFWQYDTETRAVMYNALKKFDEGEVTIWDMWHVLAGELGINVHRKTLHTLISRNRKDIPGFCARLKARVRDLEPREVLEGERRFVELFAQSRERRARERAENASFMKSADACALIADLLELTIEPVQLGGREPSSQVPLMSLATIISSHPDLKCTTTYQTLKNKLREISADESEFDTPSSRAEFARRLRVQAERLRKEQGSEHGTARVTADVASQAWSEYLTQLRKEALFQSPLFRRPDIAALAIVCLEDTEFSSGGISRIIKDIFPETKHAKDIGRKLVSKERFKGDHDMQSRRQLGANLLREYCPEPITDEMLAAYRSMIPRFQVLVDRYNKMSIVVGTQRQKNTVRWLKMLKATPGTIPELVRVLEKKSLESGVQIQANGSLLQPATKAETFRSKKLLHISCVTPGDEARPRWARTVTALTGLVQLVASQSYDTDEQLRPLKDFIERNDFQAIELVRPESLSKRAHGRGRSAQAKPQLMLRLVRADSRWKIAYQR